MHLFFSKTAKTALIAISIFAAAQVSHSQTSGSVQNNQTEFADITNNFPVVRIFEDVQIHAISKDQRGLAYFGFSEGIAEFDGVEWRKIEIPNELPIYSLTTNENGRIYGGGKNQLGYLLVDEFGNTKFRSLLEGFSDKFNDSIVNILTMGSETYFVGLKSITLYEGEELSLVAQGKFISSAELGNTLVVTDEDKGLLYLVNGELVPVSEGETLRPVVMQKINQQKILMATRSEGFFTLKQRGETMQIAPWQNSAQAYLNSFSVSSLDVLNENLIAIGTYGNGIIIADEDGTVRSHFNRNNGLLNNSVYDLYFTGDGNLWAGLNEGASLLNLSRLYVDLQVHADTVSTKDHQTAVDSAATQSSSPGWFTRMYNKIAGWFGVEASDTTSSDALTKLAPGQFAAIIRRVEYTPTDSVIFGGAYSETVNGVQVLQQADTADHAFPHYFNAFRFSYAANKYEELESLQFQVKLEGLDRRWSGWSKNTYREYTNLDWGEYTFRVKAKNAEADTSLTSAYSFTIIPPWYEATWFYFLQFAVLLSALTISALLNKAGKALSLSESIIAIVVIVIFQYVEFYTEPYLDEYSNNIAIFKVGLSVIFGFSLEYIEEGFLSVMARLTGINDHEKDEEGKESETDVESKERLAAITGDI